MCNSLKVDQKGRLKIPLTFLATLAESGSEFYVTSENGGSVRIYPLRVWNDVERRLERLCSRNRNNQKLLVRAKYFGQAVTMDKQDRVLIPIILRKCLGMKSAVDVLTYVNYLEVWNHARLMKYLKSSPITAQGGMTLNELSSAPRFPRAVDWKNKKGHVHGKEWGFRLHLATRFKALEPIRLGARAWPDLARSPMKMH
jgi:division/cell wall cluster transcriptional repressor MraZ